MKPYDRVEIKVDSKKYKVTKGMTGIITDICQGKLTVVVMIDLDDDQFDAEVDTGVRGIPANFVTVLQPTTA